jgi:1-acyl-sn-glycerol-3-phosphate acyltransferase
MGDVVDLRPEELRAATIKRRLVTVPVVYLMFIVVTALIVPLLVGAFIWDLAMLALKRRPPSATRLILILWGLLIADAIGIVALLITWITAGFGTNRQRLGATAFKIQSVWANWMYGCAKHSFRLNFDVQGREDCAEGPYILLVRHSSMVDNLLPSHSISVPLGVELRYVMKRELLNDPCFDICGRRMPNHFVDREAGGAEEVARVRNLATGMGAKDGVLIYPEGTRYTKTKFERALQKIAERNPQRAERMAGLTQCLPPRHGGVKALMEGAPEADIVLLIHVGFEGLRGIGDVLKGDLVGRDVIVRLVRFPRSSIPEGDAVGDWLDSVWLDIDAWVAETRSAIAAGTQLPEFATRVAV